MSEPRGTRSGYAGFTVQKAATFPIHIRRGSILVGVLAILLASAPSGAEESVDPRSGQVALVVTDLTVPAGRVVLEVRRTLRTEPEAGWPPPRR